MAHAIEFARGGFEIHPFLFGEMFEQCSSIGLTGEGREIFMPDGTLLLPGDLLVQAKAARTLERLRDEGMDYYLGDFTHRYCETVKGAGGLSRVRISSIN